MSSLNDYQRQGSRVFLPEDVLNDLTLLFNNGLREEAYRLVVTTVKENELSWESGALEWAENAQNINGNDPSFATGWIRTYTLYSSYFGGKTLTRDGLQEVSDLINESFIGGIIDNNGELPALQDIIINDAAAAVDTLGLDVPQWAGWLFGDVILGYEDKQLQQTLGTEFWPDSFLFDLAYL